MTNQTEIILKMIEEVDPSDTAKLDEIDARVFCYLEGADFVQMVDKPHQSFDWLPEFVKRSAHNGKEYNEALYTKYTRSRDALKALRTEGCMVFMSQTKSGFLFEINSGRFFSSFRLPTEELAELHAIIQAIEYERNNLTNK